MKPRERPRTGHDCQNVKNEHLRTPAFFNLKIDAPEVAPFLTDPKGRGRLGSGYQLLLFGGPRGWRVPRSLVDGMYVKGMSSISRKRNFVLGPGRRPRDFTICLKWPRLLLRQPPLPPVDSSRGRARECANLAECFAGALFRSRRNRRLRGLCSSIHPKRERLEARKLCEKNRENPTSRLPMSR